MLEIINKIVKLYNKQITKVLSTGFPFSVEQNNYGCYTELIDFKKNPESKTTFPPSFIQNTIAKRYKIRVFYLDSKMYAMVIFLQKDKKTRTNFRNYNNEKPNRSAPFLLLSKLKKQQKVNLLI